jgi:hypothetical protein
LSESFGCAVNVGEQTLVARFSEVAARLKN